MRYRIYAAMAATVMVSSVASAQVVFEGGAPDPTNGNEFTEWVQYEDFAFAAPTTVEGIRFWAGDENGANPWLGSIVWSISADNAGAPGALLFSGTQAGTQAVAGANGFGGNSYLHELAVNFALGAGTFWLGLHNGDLSNTTRLAYYWETTSDGFGSTGLEDQTPFGDGSFFDNRQQHAFQLVGEAGGATVPEPATMTLLATGLVGLAGARRRRKA